jgi:isocitrate dehydrogenase kinase/phosphatase
VELNKSAGKNDESITQGAVEAILQAFLGYQQRFAEITRRARGRFEQREWRLAQQDARERLDLYKKIVDQTVPEIEASLGNQVLDNQLWVTMKSSYADRILGQDDLELAETFFNSITRRIFTTVGVDRQREFVDSDFILPPLEPEDPSYLSYQLPESNNAVTQKLIYEILCKFPFCFSYRDLENDAGLTARAFNQHLDKEHPGQRVKSLDLLQTVFYRGNAAYLVGRLTTVQPLQDREAQDISPVLIALRHDERGVFVDTALLDEDLVSIVFSFTRSYFHVEVRRPHALIAFLKSILPLKPIAELYIAIGYNKHGKTELYRGLMQHMAESQDSFEIARGERGMVMSVFTLPSYDLVFKVIKDRIEQPKNTSRPEVMERYDLVFRHDRAGRLVDAQEFEYLKFNRSRFSQALLEELLADAPGMLAVEDEQVVLKHLYVERRLVPLNLFVKEAPLEQAEQAVIDYGQTIKDLAATNIFPGDVLLKNFGVTRHGRVVFYDYDELTLLTDCNFRRMPLPRDDDEAYSADPWFYIGPKDIFPEQFRTFLGLRPPLRGFFIDQHRDLFGVEFWHRMQARIQAGDIIEVFPYPEAERFHPDND